MPQLIPRAIPKQILQRILKQSAQSILWLHLWLKRRAQKIQPMQLVWPIVEWTTHQ
jgi:hypothetical protein